VIYADRTDMKRLYIFVLLVLLTGASLSAKTIFIYTVSEGTEETLKTSVPYMEDGIFKTLFDAGHIAFNDSSIKPVAKRGLENYKEPEDFLTAKAGGASLLIEIHLHYRVEDEKEIPEYAEYRLFNVISGNLLTGGISRIVSNGEQETEEEKLENMGKRMVLNILDFL